MGTQILGSSPTVWVENLISAAIRRRFQRIAAFRGKETAFSSQRTDPPVESIHGVIKRTLNSLNFPESADSEPVE